MGAIISRFKRNLTAKEQLEKIEQQLEYLEDYKWNSLKSQKHSVGLLFLVSILVYVFVLFHFYFYKFRETKDYKEIAVNIALLACFPILVYVLKRGLQWYYVWDIDSQEQKVRALKREKKKLLDKVMETETYKVAKELLEKYDPGALKDKSQSERSSHTVDSATLRYRTSNAMRLSPNQSLYRTPALQSFTPQTRPFSPTPLPVMNVSQPLRTPMIRAPRLPRPVFPQNRGVVEKLVDYVVGDGPSNRYALICLACKCHNGMALKDEFEYLAFRCCYCQMFNPSRKERPFAPRLPLSIESDSGAARSSLTPVVDEPESDNESKNNITENSSVNIVEISQPPESEAKKSEESDKNEEKREGDLQTSEAKCVNLGDLDFKHIDDNSDNSDDSEKRVLM